MNNFIDMMEKDGRVVSFSDCGNMLKLLGRMDHCTMFEPNSQEDAQALYEWLAKNYKLTPKTLTMNDINFNVVPLTEDVSVEGNVLVSGDDEADRKAEQDIIDRLDQGDVWAWCTVCVEANYKNTLFAKSYLGCCSYENQKEFLESDYYKDMQHELLNELQQSLETLLNC